MTCYRYHESVCYIFLKFLIFLSIIEFLMLLCGILEFISSLLLLLYGNILHLFVLTLNPVILLNHILALAKFKNRGWGFS